METSSVDQNLQLHSKLTHNPGMTKKKTPAKKRAAKKKATLIPRNGPLKYYDTDQVLSDWVKLSPLNQEELAEKLGWIDDKGRPKAQSISKITTGQRRNFRAIELLVEEGLDGRTMVDLFLSADRRARGEVKSRQVFVLQDLAMRLSEQQIAALVQMARSMLPEQ